MANSTAKAQEMLIPLQLISTIVDPGCRRHGQLPYTCAAAFNCETEMRAIYRMRMSCQVPGWCHPEFMNTTELHLFIWMMVMNTITTIEIWEKVLEGLQDSHADMLDGPLLCPQVHVW